MEIDLPTSTSDSSTGIVNESESDESTRTLQSPHSSNTSDTERIQVTDDMVPYFEDQLKKALSSGQWRELVMAKIGLGDAYAYGNLRKYDIAEKVFMEALQLARKYDDHNLCGIAYHKLARMFATSSNYPLSLCYYFEFLKESKKSGNILSMCEAYQNISDLYAYSGNKKLYLKFYEYYYVLTKKLNLGKPTSEFGILLHINVLRENLKLPEFTDVLVPGIYAEIFEQNIYTDSRLMSDDQSQNTSNQMISLDYYFHKGLKLYYLKKFDKALIAFTQNLNKVNEIVGNFECKFRLQIHIGACWRELHQFDTAIQCFISLEKMLQESSDSTKQNAALCLLENCYRKMSEYSDGEKDASDKYHNYQQQRIVMIKENSEVQALPINTLGEINFFAGNYDEVIKLYQILLKEAEKNNNELDKYLSYCNIGLAHFFKGSMIDASEVLKDAKTIGFKLRQGETLGHVYYSLYQIYRTHWKELDTAMVELDLFINLSSQLSDNYGLCLGYESKSDLYVEMGDKKEAHKFAEKHLKYAKIVGDIYEILGAGKSVDQLRISLRDASATGNDQ